MPAATHLLPLHSCYCLTLPDSIQGQVLNPDTEDATRTFGALVADYFDADHQILAWSGAAQNPYPSDQAELLESVTTPTVPQLFSQLIAGNMSSVIANTSAWVPQVLHSHGPHVAACLLLICHKCLPEQPQLASVHQLMLPSDDHCYQLAYSIFSPCVEHI